MKKIVALAVILTLLLSLGAVFASAADSIPDVPWTPGSYAGGSGESFSPVGTIDIQWDEDVAGQVNMADGDISDWLALGYTPTVITADNMISWVGGEEGVRDSGMPAEWGITAYYVADPTYLYMIYDITDSDFTYATGNNGYNGDALQMAIDFGGKLQETAEESPGTMINNHAIFYSFACVEDGAPLEIQLQESDQDGMLSEANGDGIRGTARKTEKGWSAEVALSWEMLYSHYEWKAWADSPSIYISTDGELPLSVNMCLYYLNRTDPATITWAAGTVTGVEISDGTPGVSWTVYDAGMELKLYYQQDMVFDCGGLKIMYVDYPYETELPHSFITEEPFEPPYDPPVVNVPPDETTPVINWATEPAIEVPEDTPSEVVDLPAVDTEAVVEDSEDLDEKMNDILQKYGCSAVAGAGTLTALLALAAACVLKKKD